MNTNAHNPMTCACCHQWSKQVKKLEEAIALDKVFEDVDVGQQALSFREQLRSQLIRDGIAASAELSDLKAAVRWWLGNKTDREVLRTQADNPSGINSDAEKTHARTLLKILEGD